LHAQKGSRLDPGVEEKPVGAKGELCAQLGQRLEGTYKTTSDIYTSTTAMRLEIDLKEGVNAYPPRIVVGVSKDIFVTYVCQQPYHI
jgi:hypothetical protein